MNKVLSTTSSFEETPDILKLFKEKGLSLILNPLGRTLTEEEGVTLVQEHQPIALLAGTGPLGEKVFRAGHPHLKVISRIGTGWDNVDRKLAEELGIKVCRTPDAPTRAAVELTIGLLIDLNRSISLQDRWIRAGAWQKKIGRLISRKTLGLIGCGRIGKGVAKVAQALGCEIRAYDPCPDHDWHQTNNVPLVSRVETLFETSDFISIHASYSPELKHFINRDLLSHARRGLILINISRGGIIDESSLLEALQSGQLGGAAFDVFEKEPYQGPLRELENVILTPHIGAHTLETRTRMEMDAVKNLIAALGF